MECNGKLETLLAWASEIGITDSPPCSRASSPITSAKSSSTSCLGNSLTVSFFPNAGGRGLAAARDLEKGEMLLRVPRAALLSRESVLRDENIASCVQKHSSLSPNQILTVCLLAEIEKGKGSWWYPYLVELPCSYDTLSNFSSFEIEALQVEDAMWISQKAILNAESDWKSVYNLMQEIELRHNLLSFKSWLWASATISSRTLHVPWDSAGCLCPIGDLFNYAAPEEDYSSKCEDVGGDLDSLEFDYCSQRLTDGGYDEDYSSYCFYARKRNKKGEQVHLSYGTYTNLELLEHYGFLLYENPNDKVFTQLDSNIYKVGSWPRESLYIQMDGIPSFALLSSIRLWKTPTNLRRIVGFEAYSGNLLSIENELLVMNWLANHCREILSGMQSSIEDDSSLLRVIEDLQSDYSGSRLFPDSVGAPWGGEFCGFFQAIGVKCSEMGHGPISRKGRKSLGRWRLAVMWRLKYKTTLFSCISHCKAEIHRLSSAGDIGRTQM